MLDRLYRFLLTPLREWHRKRIRRMIRGYRFLTTSHNLHVIGDLHQALREKKINIVVTDFSEAILGDAMGSADLVIRQRVSKIRDVLTKALLIAVSSPGGLVICPLPRQWGHEVQNAGFNVAHRRCEALWYLYIMAQLALGFVAMATTIGRSFWRIFPTKKFPSNYVYFCNLKKSNLPRSNRDSTDHCVVGWYCQWSGKHKGVCAIHHSVKDYDCCEARGFALQYQSAAVPGIEGMLPNLCFVLWAIKAAFICVVDTMRGRWWHALLLRESADAKALKLASSKRLAKQYMFHNGIYFPPLWAYSAQSAGSEVLLYFYSTNSEVMQRYRNDKPTPNMYSLMNWPHYLVWDQYQAEVVKCYEGPDSKVEIVGPIWFEDNGLLMPDIDYKTVAVFDVQPFRKTLYCSLGLAFEYYVPDVACKFLLDAQVAITACNGKMLYKAKREVGPLVHPTFQTFRNSFIEQESVCNLDPGISAYRVIETAGAVNSMPFTSTALLAREMRKPTAFYDPSGRLQKNDPAAHGIPVFQNCESLTLWLKDALNNKNLVP